jgi:hypothetical protein
VAGFETVVGFESGQNCTDCLLGLTQPSRGGISHERKPNMDMDQFIRRQNVERYNRLLDRVTEESDRQKISNLLAQEQQKQKDSGDPLQ